MIEITAKLSRSSVYFTGEELTCSVTFTNVVGRGSREQFNDSASTLDNVSINSTNSSNDQHQQGQPGNVMSNGDGNEMLALAGAQIYCHCSVDEAKVKFIPPEEANADTVSLSSTSSLSQPASSLSYSSHRETSFNPSKTERGHVIYSTSPRILFCMLQLRPGESKTFVFSETIPLKSPPSYYGSSIKYLYKLTIGTQRVGSVMQLLRIPLRILSFEPEAQFQIRPEVVSQEAVLHSINSQTTIASDSHNLESISSDGTIKSSDSPANTSHGYSSLNGGGTASTSTPSFSTQISDSGDFEGSELDLLIHRLDCLTTRKSPSSYVITNSLGKVAKFSLLKSCFKLGDDIIGIFDFSISQVPCVQFSVTLQSEETISKDCLLNTSKTAAVINNHSFYDEYCLQTLNTQIILPVPLTITPGFGTNIVSLSWKLHFEFTIAKKEEMKPIVTKELEGVMIKHPSTINVQTMIWDLPIEVYPSHPLAISRGMQLPSSSTLTV